MSPTLTSVYEKAGDPYLNGQIGAEAALDMANKEMKEFMVKNTRKNDLTMFMDLGDNGAVETLLMCRYQPFCQPSSPRS